MKNPSEICQKCDKLKIMSLYMDGSKEYVCGCPQCEYREAYLKRERKERSK